MARLALDLFEQQFLRLLGREAGDALELMVLSPGKSVDQAPIKSTSGLLVAYHNSALTVLHVMTTPGFVSDGAGDNAVSVSFAKPKSRTLI